MEIIKRDEVTDSINDVIAYITDILNEERDEQYLEGIILLYGLIENILKVALYYHVIADRIDEIAAEEVDDSVLSEIERALESISGLNFYRSLCCALKVGLIDCDFFHKLDKIRENRNSVVHQLWLLKNRDDKESLRKELENLAAQTSTLVDILNKLIDEVGLDIEEASIDRLIIRKNRLKRTSHMKLPCGW